MVTRARARGLAALALAAAALGALTACAADATVEPLQGSWVLVSGSDADGAFIDSASPVTLRVEGRDFSGDSPCNLYSGTLSVTGGGLRFGGEGGGIQTTERACADPEQMQLEGRYYDALVGVSRAESTGDELVLTGPGVELVFRAD